MTSTQQEQEEHWLDGARFTTVGQARTAARALSWAEDGEEFVRACVKTPAGREFLGSDEWRALQCRLVDQSNQRDRLHPSDDYLDGGEVWDAYVDEMVKLPTVKMAHEFLCRMQSRNDLARQFLASPIWQRWARARFPELDPVTGVIGVEPRAPKVGDDVLYVSYGTPGGEFGRQERTARVTEAGAWITVEVTGDAVPRPGALRRVVEVWSPMAVRLFVMNPSGTFHAGPVEYDEGELVTDETARRDLADVMLGGDRVYPGGTWHWPPFLDVQIAAAPLSADEQRRVEAMAAGICPDHGPECASWVKTIDGGQHVGPPRWKS